MSETTKYQSAVNVSEEIEKIGLSQPNPLINPREFQTMDWMVINRAHRLLMDNSYYLLDSDNSRTGVFSTRFRTWDASFPYSFTLHYVATRIPEEFALLHIINKRTVNYATPYKTVPSLRCSQAKMMEQLFEIEYPEHRAYWVPIFHGSPLV